tara:strand:+ start:5058 stop:5348 length:291 start_codon:yes stop_codon:yes gene_type:complete
MEYTFEKEEVKINVDGLEYLCYLSADLVLETTSYDPDTEAPSLDQAEVMQATTTLIMFNDHGEEVGELNMSGIGFFNDVVGTTNFEVDDDGRLIEN